MDEHNANSSLNPKKIVGRLIEGAATRARLKVRAGSITAGSVTLPYEEKEIVQDYIGAVISFAKAAGYDVPGKFIFSVGQVFYLDNRLEEVRLAGLVSGEGSDTTEWTTPTPPRLWMGPEGVPVIHPADEGRSHLSALMMQDQEAAFLWDLRTSIVETDEVAPVLNAFPNDTGKLPNNPLMAAGMAAIWKGGPRARILLSGWFENDAGRPMYQHEGAKGGRILVYPSLSRNATDPLPTTEVLWNFVENLSPFTADVALAVLAQLCEPSTGDKPKYPLLESVRISSDAILRYKGIQRWGKEHRILQERVFEEMERLRTLHFDVEKYPAWNLKTGKWEPTGASWQGDRLFDIVKVEMYQESLFGERERIEVSWLVRAGQWAYWWLNAQGRVWIARMARVLLELDHQGAAMAKKIGQRVTLLDGVLQPGALKPLRVDHLLESVGELPAPEERARNWAGRTRDRFDEAMLALREAGVFANAKWPDGCGPDDPDRSKGWAEKWLAAHVQITLPEAPPELPRNTSPAPLMPQHRRRAGPRSKKPTAEQQIDGAAIRQARTERGWSQEALARHLGISPPYLSQMENGKRLPSKDLTGRIRTWLKEN